MRVDSGSVLLHDDRQVGRGTDQNLTYQIFIFDLFIRCITGRADQALLYQILGTDYLQWWKDLGLYFESNISHFNF